MHKKKNKCYFVHLCCVNEQWATQCPSELSRAREYASVCELYDTNNIPTYIGWNPCSMYGFRFSSIATSSSMWKNPFIKSIEIVHFFPVYLVAVLPYWVHCVGIRVDSHDSRCKMNSHKQMGLFCTPSTDSVLTGQSFFFPIAILSKGFVRGRERENVCEFNIIEFSVLVWNSGDANSRHQIQIECLKRYLEIVSIYVLPNGTGIRCGPMLFIFNSIFTRMFTSWYMHRSISAWLDRLSIKIDK